MADALRSAHIIINMHLLCSRRNSPSLSIKAGSYFFGLLCAVCIIPRYSSCSPNPSIIPSGLTPEFTITVNNDCSGSCKLYAEGDTSRFIVTGETADNYEPVGIHYCGGYSCHISTRDDLCSYSVRCNASHISISGYDAPCGGNRTKRMPQNQYCNPGDYKWPVSFDTALAISTVPFLGIYSIPFILATLPYHASAQEEDCNIVGFVEKFKDMVLTSTSVKTLESYSLRKHTSCKASDGYKTYDVESGGSVVGMALQYGNTVVTCSETAFALRPGNQTVYTAGVFVARGRVASPIFCVTDYFTTGISVVNGRGRSKFAPKRAAMQTEPFYSLLALKETFPYYHNPAVADASAPQGTVYKGDHFDLHLIEGVNEDPSFTERKTQILTYDLGYCTSSEDYGTFTLIEGGSVNVKKTAFQRDVLTSTSYESVTTAEVSRLLEADTDPGVPLPRLSRCSSKIMVNFKHDPVVAVEKIISVDTCKARVSYVAQGLFCPKCNCTASQKPAEYGVLNCEDIVDLCKEFNFEAYGTVPRLTYGRNLQASLANHAFRHNPSVPYFDFARAGYLHYTNYKQNPHYDTAFGGFIAWCGGVFFIFLLVPWGYAMAYAIKATVTTGSLIKYGLGGIYFDNFVMPIEATITKDATLVHLPAVLSAAVARFTGVNLFRGTCYTGRPTSKFRYFIECYRCFIHLAQLVFYPAYFLSLLGPILDILISRKYTVLRKESPINLSKLMAHITSKDDTMIHEVGAYVQKNNITQEDITKMSNMFKFKPSSTDVPNQFLSLCRRIGLLAIVQATVRVNIVTASKTGDPAVDKNQDQRVTRNKAINEEIITFYNGYTGQNNKIPPRAPKKTRYTGKPAAALAFVFLVGIQGVAAKQPVCPSVILSGLQPPETRFPPSAHPGFSAPAGRSVSTQYIAGYDSNCKISGENLDCSITSVLSLSLGLYTGNDLPFTLQGSEGTITGHIVIEEATKVSRLGYIWHATPGKKIRGQLFSKSVAIGGGDKGKVHCPKRNSRSPASQLNEHVTPDGLTALHPGTVCCQGPSQWGWMSGGQVLYNLYEIVQDRAFMGFRIVTEDIVIKFRIVIPDAGIDIPVETDGTIGEVCEDKICVRTDGLQQFPSPRIGHFVGGFFGGGSGLSTGVWEDIPAGGDISHRLFPYQLYGFHHEGQDHIIDRNQRNDDCQYGVDSVTITEDTHFEISETTLNQMYVSARSGKDADIVIDGWEVRKKVKPAYDNCGKMEEDWWLLEGPTEESIMQPQATLLESNWQKASVSVSVKIEGDYAIDLTTTIVDSAHINCSVEGTFATMNGVQITMLSDTKGRIPNPVSNSPLITTGGALICATPPCTMKTVGFANGGISAPYEIWYESGVVRCGGLLEPPADITNGNGSGDLIQSGNNFWGSIWGALAGVFGVLLGGGLLIGIIILLVIFCNRSSNSVEVTKGEGGEPVANYITKHQAEIDAMGVVQPEAKIAADLVSNETVRKRR